MAPKEFGRAKVVVLIQMPDGTVQTLHGYARQVSVDMERHQTDPISDYNWDRAWLAPEYSTHIDWSSGLTFTRGMPSWDDVAGPAAELSNRRELEA